MSGQRASHANGPSHLLRVLEPLLLLHDDVIVLRLVPVIDVLQRRGQRAEVRGEHLPSWGAGEPRRWLRSPHTAAAPRMDRPTSPEWPR